MKTSARVVRFGPNELDLERYELRRLGRRLRLAKGPMEVLLLLVEERGRLVTREQIAARLWTEPQLVDVVQGINTAINRLRGVLNDDAAKPRYIETVIGKGYRFIAELEIEPVESTAVDPVAPQIRQPTPIPLPSFPAVETEPSLSPTIGRGRPSYARNWLIGSSLAVAAVLVAVAAVRSRTASSPEQRVFRQFTRNDSDNRVTAAAISRDGRLVAYADATGVWLRAVSAATEQSLPSPAGFLANRISWFADDVRLAISGYAGSNMKPQIWMVFVTGQPARLLRDAARNGVPSPDGTSFAYTGPQDEDIRVGATNSEEAQVVVPATPGQSLPWVFWSGDSKQLLFQRKTWAPASQATVAARHEHLETNYRWTYESADAHSGQILARRPNFRFDSACLLPGGHALFLQWNHDGPRLRSSLLEADAGPAEGVFHSGAKPVVTFDRQASALSASSDGKEIAAVLASDHPSVYVGDLLQPGPHLGGIKRLTRYQTSDFPHAWTPDSSAIIFESNRSGKYAIYRQAVGDATAQLIALLPRDSFLPQTAPGGKWILFAGEKSAAPGVFALYRVPLAGGMPEEVLSGGVQMEFRCPLGRTGTCVLRESLGHQQFVYYELDPLQGKGRELGRTSWTPSVLGDWDVSPDSSSVALPIHDVTAHAIRIVPIGAARERRHEEQIVTTNFGALSGVSYAADGAGLYAGACSDAGCDLLFVDRRGKASLLMHSANGIWGVPSPDGTKLAFVDHTTESNVWLSSYAAAAPIL